MIKLLCDMTKEELIEARDTAELYIQEMQEEIDGVQQQIHRIEYELAQRKKRRKWAWK